MAPHSKAASPGTTPTDLSHSLPSRIPSPAPAVSNPFRKGSKIPLPNTSASTPAKSTGEGSKFLSPAPTSTTPNGPRPQYTSSQQPSRKPVNDTQAKAKTVASLTTKRSNLPRRDKPLPSTPTVNVIASSPARNSRTLLDATEHPPLRQSPGTPEEKEWPSLSPEKANLADKPERHAAAGTSDKVAKDDAIDGRSEALAKLSMPATPSRMLADRTKSSPSMANRATVATFHKATLVDHNSPNLGSRRSAYVSPSAKDPATPTKQRRISDPGSPPSSVETAGGRVVHKSYGQTLTISKEADRVIFGGPSRKPTFTELCNVNLKQRDGSEGCNIVASARPLAKQKENGRGTDVTEEDQRGRSVESTPTKGSGHQRTPTPHSNLIFGSRTTGSARVPAKEEVAPWTSNESTTAAGTTAARPIKSVGEHPPRSDSLRNIHAPDAQAETTSTSMMTRDGPHDVKAAVEPRKMPQSVAESSFEAFLPKAKSANVDVRLSNKPAPGQMLPEKQLPEPATGQSAQATPADSSTASSSRGEQDSTFSCRIARRDTDSTATGSQLTENGSHRSRSRGRRVISNLKDMFHRRAAENKDAVPPLPARSFSRKHVSPLHIKKNIPPSSYAAPKQPSPSPRSLTTPNLNIPKPRASPSFRRDASTFMTEESTSSTRKQVEHSETGLSSKAAETVPESASKSTQAKQKKEDPIFRLTSQAYSLIDRVKVEPDHTKKEAMLTTAQLAMDCVANARETEKAMHKAQQAAKEAEISYQLVKAGVGEVGRTISGMNFEKSL